MYSLCFVWLAFFVIVTSADSSTSSSFSSSLSDDDGTYCDGTGWVAYLDQKCYKLIKKWTSRDEAKELCVQEGLPSDRSIPQLAAIKFSHEQTYLTELVFGTSAVTISVWLGAKRVPNEENKFVWDDGSEMEHFNNWAVDSPSDKIQQSCVAMKSNFVKRSDSNSTQNTAGQWRDVPCEMPNYVICEKLQRWSFAKLQKTLIETRNKLWDSNELLNQQLMETNRNLVPIGFLYKQLPNEKAPSEIWHSMTWKDISSEYAGVFFRVSGGGAEWFGQVQEESYPRISNFTTFRNGYQSLPHSDTRTTGIPGSSVISGYFLNGIAFNVTAGEVRPHNMAIRIWKRIG